MTVNQNALRILSAGIAIAAAAVAASMASCTATSVVPGALDPGAGSSLAMIVPASGVQIYECRAKKDDVGAFEWAFVAPDAELYDARGNVIGRHGAGPMWVAADGSRVKGAVMARVDAPSSGAIPWLLLTTKSMGPKGSFSPVTYIQRVNTLGGTQPAKPCNADFVGKQTGVHYTADYRFFVSTSTN